MEQHVGMRTFYKNMRSVVDSGEQISADWVEVNYTKSLGITKNLSPMFNHLLGTSFGVMQSRRGLINNDADVTFYCTQVPALLAGRAVQQTPYVLCTDITPIQYDAWASEYNHLVSDVRMWEQYKYQRNRDCFQNARYVIAWSTWTAESLINDYHVSPSRIEVIPPGVDLAVWKPRLTKAADGPLNILFVGGDFERKGGDVLLEAFRKLPKGQFHLHIVTKAAVPEEAGVTVHRSLLPNSADLVALYQQADVYVHPAKAEAYGISAVEASAAGLPVIASRVGGLKSVVDDGVTGHLLDSAEPEEICQLLFGLADNPARREAMGRAARQRAELFFDVNNNVERVLSILDAAASGVVMSDGGSPMRGTYKSLPKRALA